MACAGPCSRPARSRRSRSSERARRPSWPRATLRTAGRSRFSRRTRAGFGRTRRPASPSSRHSRRSAGATGTSAHGPPTPVCSAARVPAYGDRQTAELAATPQECFDALTDFEHLPEWQRAVCGVDVLERDERGRGTVIEFVVDARFKRVRYRLRQRYDEPARIGSEYLGGDFRDFAGEWRFEARPGG